MASYSTDVELGVTAGVDLVTGFDAYIERNSGTSVGDSLNDITAAATGNDAQFPANTGSLTGRNLSYFCSNITGGSASTSAPITFTDSSIFLGASAGTNLGLPLTLTNVNIHSTHPDGTSFNWGTFGNGSGTYAVLDADGHVTTNGSDARGISRPWNWTNVNVFGSGGMRMLINGARPGQSTFTNVNFNPAPGRGAFGELPFLAFADATWGQFYRDDNFPNAGDVLWARITGGMDRNDIDINTNWMIQPQWDIRNLDGETAQVAVDGRCFVYFVNMNLPANVGNLTLRGGQGTSSVSSGQQGPTRIIQAYGWNPIVNKPTGNETNDVKYVWDNGAFNVQTVPATFTGGNTDGTAVQPADFASGGTEPTGFNGLFILQTDTGAISLNTIAAGNTVEQYTARDIHIFSYDTQVNTLDGTTFNDNFGRAIPITPLAHEINADLTWRAQQDIEEQVDVFLNGRTLAQGDPTETMTTLEHVYPTLKAYAYNNPNRSDQRFRVAPFEGGLRFLNNTVFTDTLDTQINASGLMIMRLQVANTGVGIVSSLDFRDENDANISVNWLSEARTFDAAITITGGIHVNFPENWASGLTIVGATTLSRPTAGTTLDYTNVNIPDGTTVTFSGTDAFSISGLTDAEQARIVNTDNSITFVAAPVTNTLRIPAQSGKFAIRVRDGSDTEAVAPRRFSTAEITAGFVEFTLSNQTSPSGAAFSDLVAGDMVDVYVKYDSLISSTADNVVYQESLQTLPYNAVTNNTVLNVNVPLPVTEVLVGRAVPTPNGVGFVGSQVAQNRVQFLVSGANSDNANIPGGILTNFQSQGLAIEIANDQEYFNAWYNNRATTTSPIAIYPVAAAEWDPSRIVFGSGNTEPFTQGSQTVNIPVQQRGADWSIQAGTSGVLYLRGAGVDELSFPPSLQASLNTVAQAASAGLDSSATAARVQNAERGIGFIVGDTDNDGNPVGTRSRFAGIRPKRSVYNDATPYEDIL